LKGGVLRSFLELPHRGTERRATKGEARLQKQSGSYSGARLGKVSADVEEASSSV